MMSPLRRVALLASTIALGSCSDFLTGPDEMAARIDIISGNNQSGRVSSPLEAPLVVRVRSSSGTPVNGATVRFVPAEGSGFVSVNTVVTDTTGTAEVIWTLSDTLGTKRLSAFVAGRDTVEFSATAVPDRLEIVSGNNQLARGNSVLAQPVIVRVIDLLGRPAVGVSVAFTPTSGSGSVVPSVVASDASGTARTVWTLGSTFGTKTLQVTAPSVTTPITVSAAATQDQLSLVTGGNQTFVAGGTLPAPIVVQVRDQFGTAVPGVNVTFSPVSGSGTVSQGAVLTDNTGTAQTTWTIGAAIGAKSLTIAAGTATPLTVSATALSTDSIQVVSGATQAGRAGVALPTPIIVRVRDALGRAVQGASVEFVPDTGSGSVASPSATTDGQGQAQTTWTLGTRIGTMRLVARVGATTSVAVTATATRDRLELRSGGAQSARPASTLGEPIVVRLLDLNGSVVAGVPVTFTPSAGSVLPATVVTDADGQARTAWTLGATPGLVSLTVTAATTEPLIISATATQDELTLVSGGDQLRAAGAALAAPVVVQLRDQAGAPLAGLPITFTPAAGSGTVGATTVVTNAQGQAQTAWTLGSVPGAKTLTIAGGSAAQLTVRALALAVDSLLVTGGNAQTSPVGQALSTPISVVVREREEGRPVSGATVTFTPTAGSGTVGATTVVTDAQGQAQTTWTMGTTTGAKALTITAGIATPRTATATATADTSRTLVITAGNNQTGTVNTALGTALSVTVTDRFGNPVPDVPVVWNDLLTNGITVSQPQSLTNASGVATTTARLGVALDSALVSARIQGRTETVTFLATAQAAMANVAVGNFLSCASAVDGTSYCWGTNNNGELGRLSSISAIDRAATPVTLSDSLTGPFPTFRSLALGRTTACGVTLAKRLVCWGTGNGTFGTSTPQELTVGVTPASVAVGESHTCFIDIDGFGWCGGENRLGQLGNNSFTSTTGNTAVLVKGKVGLVGDATLRLATIALGRSFSCAFRQYNPTDATTTRPVCWGDNEQGQLGRNTTSSDSSALAFPVANPLAIAAFDSTSLVAGLDHACVLSTAGNAYCWGSNGYGQLGNGGAVGSGQRQLQMVAVTMPGGQTFTRLAAGEYHTCGITAAGAAYCWGRNNSGQLGNNSQTNATTPTAVSMPSGVTFKAIALGELHSCAIAGTPPTAGSGTTSSAGRVYCWGDNEYGQLGDGATSGNRSPVLTPKLIANQP